MHATKDELLARLDHIASAPRDGGRLEMIVARTAPGQRAVLVTGELSTGEGLVGDRWKAMGAPLDMQVTLMNARMLDLAAGERARWALAGDNLIVDLDLSEENLPAGSRLSVGDAVLEITAEPHTGCDQFIQRFGREACVFVNKNLPLRLRGANARVVTGGRIATGHRIARVE